MITLVELIISCVIITAIVGTLIYYSFKMMQKDGTKPKIWVILLIYFLIWALFVAIMVSVYLNITTLTYILAGLFAAFVLISIVSFTLIKRYKQKHIDTNYDYSAVGKVVGMRPYKQVMNTVTYFMLIEIKNPQSGDVITVKTVDDYKIEDIAFYCSIKNSVNVIVKGKDCRITTQKSANYHYNPEDLEEIRQGKNF